MSLTSRSPYQPESEGKGTGVCCSKLSIAAAVGTKRPAKDEDDDDEDEQLVLVTVPTSRAELPRVFFEETLAGATPIAEDWNLTPAAKDGWNTPPVKTVKRFK
mmetsp:Transcript_47236/g.101684  ORF Transcript_47236/g.101684 Transcript_47236/m.101684 type:complete len:103 (-) Transcript_47236:250-558(-)